MIVEVARTQTTTKPGRVATLARHLAFSAVLLLFLLLGLYYNVHNPIWEAPDEPAHYEYVLHVASTRTLPIRQITVGDQFHQPPLYYVLGSLAVGWLDLEDNFPPKSNPYFIWQEPRLGTEPNAAVHTLDELPPYQGTVLAVHLLRLLSLVCCAVAVWVAYKLARLVLPEHPWVAIASAGLTALVPQFLFVASTVGNDGLAIALASLTLLLLVRLALEVQGGGTPSLRSFALLGVIVGLGMLSKLTYYSVLPLVLVVFCYSMVVGGRRRRLFGGWALGGVIGMALSGWWYARNVLVYATGLALFGQGRLDPRTLRDIPEKPEEVRTALSWYPEPLFQSFWLRFGWMNVSPERWVYDAAIGFTCLASAGLVLFVVLRALRRPVLAKSARLGLVLCFLALFFAFAVTTWRFAYTLGNHYPQGRYLYPVQSGTALLAVLGLAELAGLPLALLALVRARALADGLRRLLAPPLAVALVATFAYLSLSLFDRYVGPAYHPVPVWRNFDAAQLANPVEADFSGKVSLLGYDLSQNRIAAGEPLTLNLYWRSLSKLDLDLQAFVHLADDSGKPLAQKDAPAGLGVATTSKWEVGEVVRETRVVPVDVNISPGTYQLLIGLYSLSDMKRLPLRSPAGATTVRLGTVTVE